MKKVLFTIGALTGGGAERVVSVWSGILADRGYSVAIHVAFRCDGEYPVNERVEIHSTAESRDEYFKLSPIKRMSIKRKCIKDWRPDVIINFLPSNQIRMLFISAGIKARKIETVRLSPWKTEISKSQIALWKLCFKKSDAIIVQTERQSEFFGKKERAKCTVIRNPLSRVYIDSRRETYADTAVRFIASGRLCKQKNYPMMIKAFAAAAKQYPNITLDIFGAGSESYVAELQACIDSYSMSDRIVLRGRTNDMCTALMSADAFLMSSDYEGMPNSLAEAMATGLPCVSTNCDTGPSDMIESGVNGYLCNVGDADDMKEKILNIISLDKCAREAMGNRARSTILDLCDNEKNISKLICVIEG